MKQKKTRAPKKRRLVMGLDLSALSEYERGDFREYTPDRCREIISIVLEGHSPFVAAEKMSVDVPTVHQWAKKHPEFSDALKRAEGLYIAHLEKQLLTAGDMRTVRATMRALKRACPEEWGDKVRVPKNNPATRLEIRGALKPRDDRNAATNQEHEDG